MEYKSQSESINELANALAKAQAEMEVAIKDSNLSHFKSKYADLKEIVRVSRPCLTKYGLSVIQALDVDGDMDIIRTMLLHASGQFINSRVRICPGKAGDQELGKSITYLRRYAYASLLGVVCDEELDHDNAPKQPYKPASYAKINPDQLKSIMSALKENFDDVGEAVNWLTGEMNIAILGDLPAMRYDEAMKIINEDFR